MGSMSKGSWDCPADVSQAPNGAIENRQHVRVLLQTPGLLRLSAGDDWLRCTVVNVSDGGIQVAFHATASPVDRPYSSFLVRFRVGTEYVLEAKFVWEGLVDKQYRMGFEWVDKEHAQLERLRVELMRLAVQRRRLRR